MAIPKKANEQDIITLFEYTGRFVHLETKTNTIVFWDNLWEDEYLIQINQTVESIIKWLADFLYEDGKKVGRIEVQNAIKKTLGI